MNNSPLTSQTTSATATTESARRLNLFDELSESIAPPSAHLVGASGAGMKALGELLADRGWTLTGSDQTPRGEFETSAPFAISIGHAAEHVPSKLDLLIHSPAIRVENPEREIARQRGVIEMSYTAALAELMRQREGVCIAGTHGKTTTSAMTAFVMRECGLHPAAAVGGELVSYRRSGWWDRGRHLVVESCEYRRHFLDYAPLLATILNVEADHFDCFPTLHEASQAYAAFAKLIPKHGLLVVPEFDAGRSALSTTHAAIFDELVRQTSARIERFSWHRDSDWSAADLVELGPKTRFVLHHRGQACGHVELLVPGRHNVLNALAATALAHAAGAKLPAICDALSRFRGVRRRFEILGEWRGVTVIDDYAHHPTAVRATLRAACQAFGQRRLIAVFQPHQVSRTLNLLEEFATSFEDADDVLLVPIYAARESAESIRSAGQALFDRSIQAGAPARLITSLDHLRTTLDHVARPDDVLVLMGAGDINRIGYELTRSVS